MTLNSETVREWVLRYSIAKRFLAVSDSVAFINFSPLFVGTVAEEAPGLDDLGGLFAAGTCWSWAGLGIVIFDSILTRRVTPWLTRVRCERETTSSSFPSADGIGDGESAAGLCEAGTLVLPSPSADGVGAIKLAAGCCEAATLSPFPSADGVDDTELAVGREGIFWHLALLLVAYSPEKVQNKPRFLMQVTLVLTQSER